MPTYEYKCSKCGGVFETKQSMKDDPLTDCIREGCGGKGTVHRLIGGGIGLLFKGSGFYKTDYRKGGVPACPEAPKCEKAQEAKAAGKSCCCGAGGDCDR
jgi:putative FmdB family regulatory protein